VVFQDQARQNLSDALGQSYVNYIAKEKQNDLKLAKMMQRPLRASVVIAVSMKRDENKRISELDEMAAVSAAVQNMLLTCTAYGLGSFWSTPSVLHSPDMKKFLNLEEEDICMGLIYIGYPVEEWPTSHRKPLEYITEWRTQ